MVSFSALLDIDKLILFHKPLCKLVCFSALLDIDKLILVLYREVPITVLVLCWILINLYAQAAKVAEAQF